MKQHYAGRHVASLGHILIPSQPVFVLTAYQCWVLSGEATNTDVKVFYDSSWVRMITVAMATLKLTMNNKNTTHVIEKYIIHKIKCNHKDIFPLLKTVYV